MSADVISQRLTALTSCLRSELASAGLTMCSVALVPGGPDLSQVGPKGGVGWVTMDRADVIALSDGSVCNVGWSVLATVGVAICYPVHADGSALTEAEYLKATHDLLKAMKASHRAIACCDWGMPKRGLTIGGFNPGDPQGGAITGTWSITLDI